ncbi:MAG: hypothetical protein RL764_1723 [Pseudomonadota bacterium]|jgi:hypothetical protein
MSFSLSTFIVALVAISTFGWIITTWIRARHGYPLEGEWGGTVGKSDMAADRKIALLSSENDRLAGQITRLEERVAVLERIATDAPSRLTAEIERLK